MPNINWFPGHMAKARREISETMPEVDLVIELLDARAPFSTENPLVDSLRKETPCIKIINKSDLADETLTKLWLDYYNSKDGVTAIALSQTKGINVKNLLQRFRHAVPGFKEDNVKPLTAMILGIPNVGKSTLINKLAGRQIAKTGDEPAVTKMQQRIKLDNNILLLDTPGFLWPKLEPEECGYRLGVTGAIKAAVIDLDDVALFLADYLLEAYPDVFKTRFNIEEMPVDGISALEAIAITRRFYRKGKSPDLYKASEILLHEYRQGRLGEITLETPSMVEKEQAQLEIEKQEKERKKQERLSEKKKKHSK